MITDYDILNTFISNNKINCKKLSSNYLQNHKELLEYMLNRYSDNYTINNISEIVYRIKHNIIFKPTCICGNPLKYYSFGKGYQKHCCPKCAANDLQVKEKVKYTSRLKYGTDYANQSETVKKKIEKSNIERYGVKNVFQSNDIKEKIKQTNIKKYDVEYPAQNNDIRQKQKYTNFKRYGQECFNKCKNKQTILEKYNVENIMQLQAVKEKQQNTMLKRYNQPTSWNNGILREKQYQTCIQKYGHKCYSQTNEFKQWNSNHMKLAETQQKILNTKRKNKSFHSSKIEQQFKEYLEQYFPNDFEYQYRSELYPFNCDFYIKSLNLYIEIQGDWRHGFHPFDTNNENDLNRLKRLKELEYEKLCIKNQKKTDYTNAINIWTIRDPEKRLYVKNNNLNLLEIFSNNINECIDVLNTYINNLF